MTAAGPAAESSPCRTASVTSQLGASPAFHLLGAGEDRQHTRGARP